MPWLPDLSEYKYLQDYIIPGQKILTIGWLSPNHKFPVGTTSQEFSATLTELCATSACARTRGWHDCELPHPGGVPEYPLTVEIDGEQVPLGDAEIRVLTEDGTVLAAPNLVCHYVNSHSYRPPDEFIKAVLDRHLAPSM